MRIGVVADPPIITHSCAVVASNLAKQWHDRGHSVSYLGYGYSGSKVNFKGYFDIYPDTRPLTTKESVLKFIKDCGGVDILYLHGSKDIFKGSIEAGKQLGIPVVCHTFYSTPTKNDKVNTFEARKGFILYDCEEVDDMFVCNNFSVGVGHALGKRTWFIPNGVDTDIFYQNKDEEFNYRKKLGVSKDTLVFLFSGSNISGKDPGRAIEAFRVFLEKYPEEDACLVMHTRPSNSHLDLKQISIDMGIEKKVKFFTDYFPEWLEFPKEEKNYTKTEFSPPYTNTPYELMGNVFRTGDILLVPSLGEGMSTTILEGMACGLPVICSDDPVVSEPVIHMTTGLLCRRLLTNECIVEDMVLNMNLLRNESIREYMENQAAEYTRIKHSWRNCADQFIYHFNNLINKHYV